MLFARAYILYVILFALLWRCFDRYEINNDVINLSQPYGDDIYQIAYGRRAVDQNLLQKGVAYYDTLANHLPYPALSYANLGFCYFYLKQVDRSIHAYEHAVKIDPGVYTFYFDLAYVALASKDFDNAVAFFKKSMGLVPKAIKDLRGMLKINAAYEGTGLFHPSSHLPTRVYQDFCMIYIYLGQAYEGLADFGRMRDVSMQGAQIFAKDATLVFNAGVASYKLRMMEDALLFLSKAIELQPEYLQAYEYRAQIYKELGNKELFLADTFKIKELAPKGPWKKNKIFLDLHIWPNEILLFQSYS